MNRQQRRRLGVPREARVRVPQQPADDNPAFDDRCRALGFPVRPSEDEFRRVSDYMVWMLTNDLPVLERFRREIFKGRLDDRQQIVWTAMISLSLMLVSGMTPEIDRELKKLVGMAAE